MHAILFYSLIFPACDYFCLIFSGIYVSDNQFKIFYVYIQVPDLCWILCEYLKEVLVGQLFMKIQIMCLQTK